MTLKDTMHLEISHFLYDSLYDGKIRFGIMIFENGESFEMLC